MDIQTPTPPAEGCISTEVRGHVLLIGINRPAKRNGWTPQMFRQLAEAYTRLDDDDALRVGVLHAFGPHFTAGLDLPLIAEVMKRGVPPTELKARTGEFTPPGITAHASVNSLAD